jgi:phosphatidylglycerol lysyltransferase
MSTQLMTITNRRLSGRIVSSMYASRKEKKTVSKERFGVYIVSIIVGLHGLLILATTLLEQVASRHSSSRLTDITVDIPLLIGLSLIYLSVYLRRKKRTAWLVTVLAYTFYLGTNIEDLVEESMHRRLHEVILVRAVALPLAILFLLFALQREFVVRSDIQGFRVAARFSLIILVIAFVYGVSGFLLLDKSDFHQEIPFGSAVHHTLDQFDLTTNTPLHPYTKRAHLFVDSLSFVSICAVVYAAFSLFQPLRARFFDQEANREHMLSLLDKHHATSEDFFKVWPHDKQYFFDSSQQAGLAMHVYRGVALCLGDPAGKASSFPLLMDEFHEVCFSNDWLPAHIHVDDKQRHLYENKGYSLQKIGQEAELDIAHFHENVVRNKYFRHINNKFVKHDFTTEMLVPPHHAAIIDRVKAISDEWLDQPGRVERGFAMGYFSIDYMQQCPIMIVRDAAGTIQAFLSQIPADFDTHEATYDLLRHTSTSLSNINDFLLIRFCAYLAEKGYTTLNLGLCPLAGLDESDEKQKSFLDNVLRFAYANGDRIYSFSGLYRFKAKYEPRWSDRYIAYQGGVRGFSKTMTALTRSMRVKKH